MTPYGDIWVNIGSGNGLLPDGTKPLPEPMLTYHQYGPVSFFLSEDLIKRSSEGTNQWSKLENWIFKVASKSPRGQWVNQI